MLGGAPRRAQAIGTVDASAAPKTIQRFCMM
jgi:hypothetical protein